MKLGNLRRNPAKSSAEEGYFLIVIMIMVGVMAIVSLSHVENVVTQLKHDQEEELVHRGAQYARAIKKYFKKFNQYPVTLDQLDKTNNMRFLRKRYKDPITGGDFRLIRQADLVFNQGSGTASLNSSSTGQNPLSNPNQSSSNPDQKSNPSSSLFGNPIGTATGSNTTFGGGPFVGVASTSPKTSLMEFNSKNHYKDWMFVYLPNFDRGGLIKGPFIPSQAMGGTGNGTTNINNQINPGGNPNSNTLGGNPPPNSGGSSFGGGNLGGVANPVTPSPNTN